MGKGTATPGAVRIAGTLLAIGLDVETATGSRYETAQPNEHEAGQDEGW
jgi:hypothetical protein